MLISPIDIQRLSGGYIRPKDQIAELHRQGFTRARVGRDRRVILELAHYEAVCGGTFALAKMASDTGRPAIVPFRKSP